MRTVAVSTSWSASASRPPGSLVAEDGETAGDVARLMSATPRSAGVSTGGNGPGQEAVAVGRRAAAGGAPLGRGTAYLRPYGIEQRRGAPCYDGSITRSSSTVGSSSGT